MKLSKLINHMVDENGEYTENAKKAVDKIYKAVKTATGYTDEELCKVLTEDVNSQIITVKGPMPLEVLPEEVVAETLKIGYQSAVADAVQSVKVGTVASKLSWEFAQNEQILKVLKAWKCSKEETDLL